MTAELRLKVYRELAAPTVRWLGRTTSAVALRFELDTISEMEGLAGFRVERRVGTGAWSEVAHPGAIPSWTEWTDWSAPAGVSVAYRVSTVAQSGERSSPSTEVSGAVPASALVSGDYFLRGGAHPDDTEWVSIPRSR